MKEYTKKRKPIHTKSFAGLVLVSTLSLLCLPQSYVQGATTLRGAILFEQDLSIVGALSKGSGTFVIDHPLDPENKLLYHSFVESPDVKNIYDGITTLDAHGEAVVALPEYFEALNTQPRFLLTPIGAAAPDLFIVGGRVADNHFTISGGTPGTKVSWQVTGIRHDPYILANPIIPEVEKGPDALVEKGEYLFKEYPR